MGSVRILDLIPVFITEPLRKAVEDRESFSRKLREMTNGFVELSVRAITKGTASIESSYDEVVDSPYILAEAVKAEKEGFDAVVIDCFGDPAVDAARELLRIPVVGANAAATHMAAQIAGRFSVINILPETEPLIRLLARKYGLENSLASVRTLSVPVLELEERINDVVREAVEESVKAYREDGAYAIVLGCTGMFSLAEMIEEGIRKRGLNMPVIEPLRTAVATAVSMIIAGVSHSKLAFPTPREKPRKADFELPL